MHVLDALAIRILAVLMAVGVVGGVVAFVRGRRRPRNRLDFRAEDSPPRALQALWAATFLLPNLYPFAVAVLPSLAYGTVLNFAFPMDSVFQVLGFFLWGAGGVLVLWGGRTLGRFVVIEIGVAKDHELITAGPYARIRHPMYSGVQCMAIGLTLVFLSDVLLAFAVLAVSLANYRARKEERLLASKEGFGETYRAYMARTGRFLPRVGP